MGGGGGGSYNVIWYIYIGVMRTLLDRLMVWGRGVVAAEEVYGARVLYLYV